jgi:dienelactone hydrolase
MIEDLDYEVDGRRFSGSLALPTAPATGLGVLVCHGGSGLRDHDRAVAQQLASRGHAAFAPDLFGEAFADRAHGMRVIGELVGDPLRLRHRASAARDRIGEHAATVVVIGHCFGGLAALELARSGADVAAAVSFHGGLTTTVPAVAGRVRARVLVCTGDRDPFCPAAHRAALEHEMTEAGVDWQHHIYAGARHGFTIPDIDPVAHPGCAYHELAAARSWRAMLGLFDEIGVVSAP